MWLPELTRPCITNRGSPCGSHAKHQVHACHNTILQSLYVSLLLVPVLGESPPILRGVVSPNAPFVIRPPLAVSEGATPLPVLLTAVLAPLDVLFPLILVFVTIGMKVTPRDDSVPAYLTLTDQGRDLQLDSVARIRHDKGGIQKHIGWMQPPALRDWKDKGESSCICRTFVKRLSFKVR